jgi:hypothetical protein
MLFRSCSIRLQDNTDRVVAAFGSILSRAAPRIIQQMAENQRSLRSGQAKVNA